MLIHAYYDCQLTSALNQNKIFILAQELVMAARGKLVERNWKHNDDSPATIDDISVFAIPILPYKHEYAEWKVSKKSVQPSSHNNGSLEETGKTIVTNTEDMDIDPAEEVTVSDVSLTIKDDEEAEEEVDEDDDEAQK